MPTIQPSIREHDLPVMRRDNRSSSNFAAVDPDGPRRTSSFQTQLQRLSVHSSSSQQLHPPGSRVPRLPMISSTPDSDRIDSALNEAVEESPGAVGLVESVAEAPERDPLERVSSDPPSGWGTKYVFYKLAFES